MLSFPRLRHRGVALLMAMMFAMLMGVVARGIFRLTLGAQSRQTFYQERARQAALSGLEYARSQFARESDWKGDSPIGTTISTEGLVVREVNGNVFGLVIYPDGGKAQFRIRFNHQDGPGGSDGLPNPPSGSKILSKILSINNLEPNAPVEVPGQDSNFQVDQSKPKKGTVPAHSAWIQVEGRAGTGVDQLTTSTISSEPSGFVDTVEVESILKVELDEPMAPAVLQSAGDLDLTTVDGVTIESLDDSSPAIRSKQSISVHTPENADGLLEMEDGHVYARDSDLRANYDPNELTLHSEQASADLSNLKWEQVTKPSGATSLKLPAGTYVLWPPLSVNGEPPTSPNGVLHYYEMDYPTYIERIHNPYIQIGKLPPPGALQGITLSPSLAELKTGAEQSPGALKIDLNKVHVNQDLIINPVGKVDDFAVIPLFHGAMKSDEMGNVLTAAAFTTESVKPTDGGGLQLQINSARIQSQGDMIFKGGSIEARGATLIGESNLEFNTPSLSVTAGESNISLYFKGDINLSSFNKANEKYGMMKLAGIIYSWGNVNILTGEDAKAYDAWGNLDFIGSLVAYGGDPLSEEPGQNEKGAISVVSKSAKITYDPTTVGQLSSPEELNQATLITSVGSWIRL